MKNEGKIQDYLNNSFGWNVRFENMTAAKKSLPYILSGSAEFRLMVCEGICIPRRT